MAVAKFYAIKKPSPCRIVRSWAECEALVKGVQGAVFKSFKQLADAEAWLDLGQERSSEEQTSTDLRLYVDGSYTPSFPCAGWAWVAVQGDQVLGEDSGCMESPAESRNIDGELEAAYQAICWLNAQGLSGVICHDYEGIGRWALGEWQARSVVARQYVQQIQGKLKGIRFEKVPAHAGLKWNERVDELAKKAIERARQNSESKP